MRLWLMAVLAGCTAPNKATSVLTDLGFTEIEITGHDLFACSEDDWSSTGFIARNPAGKVVTGTVCCGLLKSCTVRL